MNEKSKFTKNICCFISCFFFFSCDPIAIIANLKAYKLYIEMFIDVMPINSKNHLIIGNSKFWKFSENEEISQNPIWILITDAIEKYKPMNETERK